MSASSYTAENGADLSAGRFKAVKYSSGALVLCSSATDIPAGILQSNAPDTTTSGHDLKFIDAGPSKGSVGAAVTAGDFLTMDANGQLITSTATTDVICAKARQDGDAQDDEIDILVCISPARGS